MSNSFERWQTTRRKRAARDRVVAEAALVASETASAFGLAGATTSSAGAAAPLRPSAGPGMGRWRVERAGSLLGGYGPGWFTYSGIPDLDAHGAWFPTWSEAMAFASRSAI